MRITDGGNVGIGVTSPRSRLEVKDFAKFTADSNSSFRGISFGLLNNNDSYGSLSMELNSGELRQISGFSTYGGFQTFYTNGSERMRITSGGEVYIAGTVDQGAYNLQVNGTGVWGAGAYVNGSDRRLKTNINAIETGLDVIEKLNPVTFNYIEEYSKDKTLQTGFIAQEMLEAMIEKDYVDSIVQKGKEFYGVAYQSLIPILVKAVQELTKRIKELESK
jgi:hypothetical protein